MSGSDQSQSVMEIDEQGFDEEEWEEYLGEDGSEGAAPSKQMDGEEEEMGEEDPEAED